MKYLRTFAMWCVWNVPLGRFAPHVMGFAMGSKPQLVPDRENHKP